MATVVNKINYYPFNSGYMVGNQTKGSCSDEDLSAIDVVFEASINNVPVVKISSKAFYGKRIKSISFPDSIEEINIFAFDSSNMKMEELKLPNSLKLIEFQAFSWNSIKKFIIGPNLKSIGDGVFSDNLALEKFEVSEENQYFSSFDNALYDKNITILYCVPYLLRNYVIPHTVKELLHRSINQQYAVNIWVPHSVTTIRSSAFFRIPNVRTIHIMGNIDKLEDNIIIVTKYSLQTFYYHGTKIYNESNAFGNREDIKIMTCSEYNYSYFGGKRAISFGHCFTINKTCKTSKQSFIVRSLFLLILTFVS